MRKIKWLTSLVASAAAATVLVVNAQAGDIMTVVDSEPIALTARQAKALGDWVSKNCESVSLPNAQRVSCDVTNGCRLISHETITADEYVSLDMLGKAGSLLSVDGNSVTTEKLSRCKVHNWTGVKNRIATLLSSDAAKTLRGFNAYRTGSDVSLVVTYVDTITSAEFIAAKQAGRAPKVVGIVK
jgi:hypothetical protein